MYTIAIVDDERWVLDMLSTYIKNEEPEFEVAGVFEDAGSALELLDKTPVDVLITDIQMFGMSGLDLAAAVCEKYPDLTVFVLSAHRNFDYARTAIKHGVTQYLLKPIDFNELSDALAAVASRLNVTLQTPPEEESAAPQPSLLLDPELLSASPQLIHNTLSYIASNYQNDLSRTDIARAVYSSPSYLSRIFKQHLGIGLMEYLMQYRIAQSVELLKKGWKLSDIAAATGYPRYITFLSHFKQCTGMSPNEYRRFELKMEDPIEK